MNLNALLKTRYIAALEAVDSASLRLLKGYRTGTPKGLNDLFLPSVTKGYAHAPVRVMVVGRETRTWNYGRQKALPPLPATPMSMADYVARGMDEHATFRDSDHCLAGQKSRSGLVRLLRSVAAVTGREGLIYSNLFAVAHNGKDPRVNKEAWPFVRDLSKALLDIQIEVLKPDVIVFANGSSSAGERRAFFPHRPQQDGDAGHYRCTDPHDWRSEGIGVAHLWGFRMDGSIQCYRIQHPSAAFHRGQAKRARVRLGEVLKEHTVQLRDRNSRAAQV